MKFKLMPRDENFYDMFSKTSSNVVEGAKVFRSLIETWTLDDERVEKIHALEKEGDLIRHELVDKLNRTFITPIDREDIYALSGELDDIIDMIQACTDRMQIYRITDINADLIRLAEILEKAVIALDKAINEMHDKKKVRRVFDHLIEVNQLENEGDSVVRILLKELFNRGKNADALEIFKLKETYEAVEAAIDKCEDVACTIESIVVKHS